MKAKKTRMALAGGAVAVAITGVGLVVSGSGPAHAAITRCDEGSVEYWAGNTASGVQIWITSGEGC